MSRAFTPPETFTDDDVRTVADVRRAIWINGFLGLGIGSATGLFCHAALKVLQDRKKFISLTQKALPPLGRNTLFLAFLGGGALGSFGFSSAAGKNSAHLLHPIFELGKEEHKGKTTYAKALIEAQQSNETPTSQIKVELEDDLDADHHRARSLQRATSIKERLEHGHSLGDSRNNKWADSPPISQTPDEEEAEKLRLKDRSANRSAACRRRQTERRKLITDKIERGHALSDSTGGHWVSDDVEQTDIGRDRS